MICGGRFHIDIKKSKNKKIYDIKVTTLPKQDKLNEFATVHEGKATDEFSLSEKQYKKVFHDGIIDFSMCDKNSIEAVYLLKSALNVPLSLPSEEVLSLPCHEEAPLEVVAEI